MLRTIVAGAVAAAALAVPAPAALAHTPTFDCNFIAVQQEDVTGQAFVGVAWGYATDGGNPVSIRCYVEVNGSQVDTTVKGLYSEVGLAYDEDFRYFAGDTDVVTFHAEVCNPGCSRHDYQTVRGQIPDQTLLDLIDSVRQTVDNALDPAYRSACPILRLVGEAGLNILGLVVVDEEGVVYVAGQPVLCGPTAPATKGSVAYNTRD